MVEIIAMSYTYNKSCFRNVSQNHLCLENTNMPAVKTKQNDQKCDKKTVLYLFKLISVFTIFTRNLQELVWKSIVCR